MWNYQTVSFTVNNRERRLFLKKEGYTFQTYRKFFKELGVKREHVNKFNEYFLNTNLVYKDEYEKSCILSSLKKFIEDSLKKNRLSGEYTACVGWYDKYSIRVFNSFDENSQNCKLTILDFEERIVFRRIMQSKFLNILL